MLATTRFSPERLQELIADINARIGTQGRGRPRKDAEPVDRPELSERRRLIARRAYLMRMVREIQAGTRVSLAG